MSNEIRKGKYLVIEGIDGSGKSTHVNLLHKRILMETTLPFDIRRTPTSGPIGKLIRRQYLSGEQKIDPRVLQTLFAADHLANDIDDHNVDFCDSVNTELLKGAHVIQDRGYMSGIAYGSSDLPMKELFMIYNYSASHINPDLVIFLDVAPEICIKRISKDREKLEIFETLERLTKIREKYLELIDILQRRGENIQIIDWNDYGDQESVHEQLWERFITLCGISNIRDYLR